MAEQANISDATARFQVASFEDFADSGPVDLIVSATAFDWVDPSVGLAKASRPAARRLAGAAARAGNGPTTRPG